VHYFAKRRLPLRAVWASLTGGSPLREIGRRYRFSPQAVHNAVIRLGRQAMGAHARLLGQMHGVNTVVLDGIRSFVSSQDYPCDLTLSVAERGETILTITHTILGRGGRLTPSQRMRLTAKQAAWRPPVGRATADIRLQLHELWDYLRPTEGHAAQLISDEHPLYKQLIDTDRVAHHFRCARLFRHTRISSKRARTPDNPMFPANYVDLLMRHRAKEHTRETIAFGRNAVSQMHRAWIFAWDHNCHRPHRERTPEQGVHATQAVIDAEDLAQLTRGFFTRRVRLSGVAIPRSIERVYLGEVITPPVRWRRGQRGTNVRIPGFARRDLAA
jgi:hypothetical protein